MKQVTMRHRSKRAEARQNASQKCRYVHNFTREYSVSPKTPTPKKKINTYLRTISTSLLDFQFNSGQPKDLGPARPQAIFESSSESYVQLFDPDTRKTCRVLCTVYDLLVKKAHRHQRRLLATGWGVGFEACGNREIGHGRCHDVCVREECPAKLSTLPAYAFVIWCPSCVVTFVRVPVHLPAREKPRSLLTTSLPSIGRIPNTEHPTIAQRYPRGSLEHRGCRRRGWRRDRCCSGLKVSVSIGMR